MLNDNSPIAVRKYLEALHEVVLYRPELNTLILDALETIDLSKYKDSMTPLLTNDIVALKQILND